MNQNMMVARSIQDMARRIRAIEIQLSGAPPDPIAAKYYTNSATNLNNGVPKLIDYDHQVYDDEGIVTTGALAWVCTIPADGDGLYKINACITTDNSDQWRAGNDFLAVLIYLNGAEVSRSKTYSQISSSSNVYGLSALIQDELPLDEGDEIKIYGLISANAGAVIPLDGDDKTNYFSIGRIRRG